MVFLGVGVIDLVFDVFWYYLCDIVIFDGFKSFILDLCGYLLIRVIDDWMDYANRSDISILG